jgi:hypothetical protein
MSHLLVQFERMAQAVDGSDEEVIIDLLKDLVPEYCPGCRRSQGAEAEHNGRTEELAVNQHG